MSDLERKAYIAGFLAALDHVLSKDEPPLMQRYETDRAIAEGKGNQYVQLREAERGEPIIPETVRQ